MSRAAVFANLATLMLFSAMMGATFLAPLALVGLYAYSLTQVAAVLTVTSVRIVLAAIPAGAAVARWGVGVGGIGLIGTGFGLIGLGALGTNATTDAIVVAAGTFGLGVGFALPAVTSAAVGDVVDVRSERVAVLSGLFSTSRQLGIAIGIGVFGSIATTTARANVEEVGGASAVRLVDGLYGSADGAARLATEPRLMDAVWSGFAQSFHVAAVVVFAAVGLLLAAHVAEAPRSVQTRTA